MNFSSCIVACIVAWFIARGARRPARRVLPLGVLALGAGPVLGADGTVVEVGASGSGARYQACGTTHRLLSGGLRASAERPLERPVTLTAELAGELAEHAADPDEGLPTTTTTGFGLARLGARHRWAGLSLGGAFVVQPGGLQAAPSLKAHLGPYDLLYLQLDVAGSYAFTRVEGGRAGAVLVVPGPQALERLELGAGGSSFGPYVEGALRTRSGWGVEAMGAVVLSQPDTWTARVGVSYRAPVSWPDRP